MKQAVSLLHTQRKKFFRDRGNVDSTQPLSSVAL